MDTIIETNEIEDATKDSPVDLTAPSTESNGSSHFKGSTGKPFRWSSLSRWTRLAIVAAIALVVSIFVEVGIFNVNHWFQSPGPDTSYQLVPTDVESNVPDENTSPKRADLSADDIPVPDGISPDAKAYERLIFNNMDNAKIYSVAFDVQLGGEPHRLDTMTVKIDIADSGQSRATYPIYEETMPERNVHIMTPAKAYGVTKVMVITVWGSSAKFDLDLANVTINVEIPLSICIWRIMLVFAAIMLLYVARPKSSLWRVRHLNRPYVAAIFAAVMMGIAAIGMLWGADDPSDAWGTPNTGARDEYAMLARAMVDDGTLYISEEPADWLLEMDMLSDGDERVGSDMNVYDMSARVAQMREAGSDVPAKLDAAYFEGKYYVYFGVVPVMLAYIPYHILTGGDLSNTIAIAIAFYVFAAFAYLIIDLLVRKKRRHASIAAVCCAYLGFILATGMTHTIAFPMFYNVPVIFAIAFLVVGTYALMRAYYAKAKWVRVLLVFVGITSLILTFGCRPQITVAALAVGLAYLIFSIRKHRVGIWDVVVAIIPIIAVVACLLLYNYARFGSLLDFGSNYNLTGNDMTLRGHNPVRMLEGLFWYLFGMPQLSMDFPYLNLYLPTTGYYGRSVVENFTFGFFAEAPYIVFLFAFLASKRLSRAAKMTLVAFTGAAVVVLLVDVEGAGVLVRYIQDFGYLLGAAFAFGLLAYDNGAVMYAYGDDGTGEIALRKEGSVAPRFSSMYSPMVILLMLSFVAGLFTWIGYFTAQPVSDIYMFDFFDIKSIFDAWGSIITLQ